ncbi:hypothetical protein HII36_02385 [Nonomuraea sp. NN258]|uniref:hypothetical protein n=1 Tax=Nonomuraea antri TaxID=2730852 RepID=UPI001569244A|nr:hypothetical protein [Nonomuraea antri]NRQ30687.1 hypothetical protein [Nonomuraea antri]
MARFAAGARRLVARAVVTGVLVAAGWLFAVLFGMLSAAPAAADATAAPGSGASLADASAGGAPAAVRSDALEAVTGAAHASASENAEAMAGITVDGLNSQQDPGLPAPSTAGKIADTNGLVPNGGNGGNGGASAGSGFWDVARSVFDPRLEARRAVLARELPPIVRTAADDPSFSPD